MKMMLYNGDCFELLKAIDLSNAIIVTDPPFNIGYHYNEYKDNLSENEYLCKMESIISHRCPSVIIHYPEMLYKIAVIAGRAPERVVSWVYNSNTQRQHRDIAFFGIAPDFNKVRQPYKNPNDKRIRERIARGCLGGKLYDWWEINQVKNVNKEKTAHPCQMPEKIMENIIGILPEDKVIVDPFMGSGTTAIACKKLKRDFIGIEIDKKYFEIAQNRIVKTINQPKE